MSLAKDRFLCIVAHDAPRKGDAIVVLEGDGLTRTLRGAQLYREGWAPAVIVSGGLDRPPISILASRMVPHLVAAGVPESAIVLEEGSLDTHVQAVETVRIANERGWTRLLLVASHAHQYRAFLTFLNALQERGLDRTMVLISAPAIGLRWFADGPEGPRLHLIDTELEKIERYGPRGHVASYEDALDYLVWREPLL